jgi:hypothetical protein
MDQAIKVAKLAAFSCLAFLCIALIVAVRDVRHALVAIQKDVQGVTEKAGVALITTNASIGQLSDQAGTAIKQISGTAKQAKSTIAAINPSLYQLHADLETADKVEKGARLSLDNVNKAAIDERLYFERDLPPLMASVQKDVDAAGTTMIAAKTLLSDSQIHDILVNSNEMTASGRAILKDGQDEVHSLTHPTKKKGFLAGFEASGDVAKHWMPSIF